MKRRVHLSVSKMNDGNLSSVYYIFMNEDSKFNGYYFL